jgi:hypothetical protein
MPDYPPIIPPEAFASDMLASEPQHEETVLSVQRSVRGEDSSNTHDLRTCGVTSLKVQSRKTGAACRNSLCLADGAQTVPSASDRRFHFAPVAEDLDIQWTFEGNDFITGATLELFRDVAGKAQRLWTKKMTWKPGSCPKDVSTLFNGTFAAADKYLPVSGANPEDVTVAVEAGAAGDFPDGCLTVRLSPYKLVLTITEALCPKVPGERWLFLDVLVHSVELDWGDPQTLLPQDRRDITDAQKKQKVLGYEKSVCADLKKANGRPGAGLKHEVILASNLFAKKNPGDMETAEMKDQTDFNEYKSLWGLGPRIPLLATVFVRLSGTGDGNRTTDAKGALGGLQVLWDWKDDQPTRWQRYLAPKATSKTKEFLKATFGLYNPNAQPRGSCNCPKEFGGKLGDTSDEAQIFPKQDGAGPFLYAVAACTTRTWAAFSQFGTGDNHYKTGVVFSPSRMAGDQYNVTAYVFLDDKWDGLDAIAAPAAVKGEAGSFEVLRRITLKHLVRDENRLGVDATACGNTAKSLYKTALGIVLEVNKTPIDNNQYKAAIKNGVEAVLAASSVYTSVPKAPLFLRNLIEFNPPADSPGVCVKDLPAVRQGMEQSIVNGRVRIVDLTNYADFLPGEEIEGIQTGNRAIVLNNQHASPPVPPPFFLLLDPAGGELWESEQVRGRASKATGFLGTYRKGSCNGHPYTVTTATGKAYKETVQIILGGNITVDVEFKKHTFSRKLKTEIPEAAAQELRAALVRAAGGKDLGGPISVEIKGRTDTANAKERVEEFKRFFDELFLEAVIDRAALVETLNGKKSTQRLPVWYPPYDDKGVGRTVKEMSTSFLLSAFLGEYMKLDGAQFEGIAFLHIAGRTNLRDLPEFKKGYQELKVTGAYYGDTLHTRREVGVVYLSTVDPGGPQVFQEASKSVQSIFSHEAAHALFMPHAPVFATGSVIPDRDVPMAHVGGDNCLMNYDVDSEHFCGLCMFRMRGWDWKPIPNNVQMNYEYQVTLELDDPDELFFGTVDNDRALAARLQALSLFNRPLDHPQFRECVAKSWDHVEKIYPAMAGVHDSGRVGAHLKAELRNHLVEGGALPPKGQFAKIRVPGGFTVMFTQNILMQMFPTPEEEKSAAAVPFNKYSLSADKSEVEQSYYDANPSLGKLPLKITVKMRPKGSPKPWSSARPARGVAVYIQLVPPDQLPGFAPIASPSGEQQDVAGGKTFYKQRVAPPLAAQPQKYLTEKVYKSADASDPQGANAPNSVGGLKGSSGRIFAIKTGSGFSYLKSGESGGKHKHSAALTTDDDGVARVFFCPSRIGGDRYKLRAYVGNPTQDFDGVTTDANRVDVVETGTMVRWRTIRICHYLRAEPPANVGELTADLRGISGRTCNHNWREGRVCPQCLLREGQLDNIDLKGKLTQEFAKSYCEIILENGALTPHPLHTHGADIVAAAEDLLTDYPDLNSAERVYLAPIQTPGFSPLQEALPAAGGSTTQFRVTLSSNSPCAGSLTVRPGFRADHSTSLVDDSPGDGTLKDLGKVPGVTGTVDYTTGDVSLTFPSSQAGKTFVVYYKPNNVADLRNLLVFPNKSPYFFQFRLPADYNGVVRAGFPKMPTPSAADLAPTKPGYPLADGLRAAMTQRGGKLGDGIVLALLTTAATRGIERNSGFLPGLILFHAGLLDTYSAGWADGTQEGKGVEHGIFIFGGASYRPGDPGLPQDVNQRAAKKLQALALHEMSHGVYLQHAPTHVQGGKDPNGAKPNLHDPNDTCVMSYDPDDGDHCGHCVALLRGMKL